MGFSLGGGVIGGALGGVGGALIGGLANNLIPQRPGAPTLPPAPTLMAPQLPNYPGMSPETQALLKQQQQYLTQGQNATAGYQNNLYLQASGGADMQALQNYQNALQGKIAPNQALAQQKERDWQATVQQAAQQGIRLSGKSPESAVSQSTAGNQIIQDFTKRYGALEQNYNLQQQQFGLQSQAQGLGQVNQQYQNTLGGYNTLAGMNTNLQQPYQQQTLGQFGVQTNQALQNSDISNQNLLNAYQQQTGQTLANYNNSLAGYNANMGLLQSGLGLAGQLLGAGMTKGASGAGGGGMGFGQQASNRLNLYNPGGSYIS